MKKIFSFICIALMCISLNSCSVYTMSDEYDRTCYHTHNVYHTSTVKHCYCNYNPDYKPITYRVYTVPKYDPNKPIEPEPRQKPHSHCHCHKHHHSHKHNRR